MSIYLAHLKLKANNLNYMIQIKTQAKAPLHEIYIQHLYLSFLKELIEELETLPDLPQGVRYDEVYNQLVYKDQTANSFKEMDMIIKESEER